MSTKPTQTINSNYIIHFEVKTKSLNEFHNIMQNVKQELPNLEACNSVKIYRDNENPEKYTLVENWKSPESHQSHVQELINNGTWEHISNLLEIPPTASYFEQL